MDKCRLHIAIPLLDEYENLPGLLHCIQSQNDNNYKVYFCVNHPEDFRIRPDKASIVKNNELTLKRLGEYPQYELIDRASKGKGWTGKSRGVGIARKTLMDRIAQDADDEDIIISLDGDTTFGEKYFQEVRKVFEANPDIPALSVPYYHPLTGNDRQDRAVLRYEIYMRTYAINMHRIGSPYRFTALGSALACRVDAYKKTGGMTPKKAGEDFYFLQKMVKYKEIGYWCSERVYPAARFSSRVDFGTGPAMIKGDAGDWSSYPVYHYSLFDEIRGFYQQFWPLFDNEQDNIGNMIFGKGWEKPLRANTTTAEQFVRACHHKFDGLRILQYLKKEQKSRGIKDEDALRDFLALTGEKEWAGTIGTDWFSRTGVAAMNSLRNRLVEIENQWLRSDKRTNAV